jgi:hypothetical protein
VFAAVLGYSKVNYESLRQQIEAGAPYAEAKLLREDGYGRHLQVDLDVVGQNGRSAVVRTGWIVVRESDTAYLTTLFVRE